MKKENRGILASAMITSFMTTFMSSALNLSIPSIESHFGVNATLVSMITAFTLGSGALESSPHTEILRMMHISFITFACICVVGLFFSLARDHGK